MTTISGKAIKKLSNKKQLKNIKLTIKTMDGGFTTAKLLNRPGQ